MKLRARPSASVRKDLERAASIALLHQSHGINSRELAERVYQDWYARRDESKPATPPGFPDELVSVFRAAHAASNLWEPGWKVTQVGGDGSLIADRHGRRRLLERTDYLAIARPGVLARPRDELVATRRLDSIDPDGSWWRTYSEAWPLLPPPSQLLRFYWNVSLPYVPTLVRGLTVFLSDLRIPWLLKLATHKSEHARADATVLYLMFKDACQLVDRIDTVCADIATHACPCSPPFTLGVKPGLSVAWSPKGNESFGQHRSRLIAEAISELREQNMASAMDAVVGHFAEEGIAITRPYAHWADPPLPWER